MLRWIVTFLALGTLTVGCAGVRINARKPVEGASTRILSSPYAPEKGEGCTKVEQVGCPYMNFSFSTVQAACAKRVLPQAEAASANYIHVNEPKQSVGGFATRNPRAILYSCTSLRE